MAILHLMKRSALAMAALLAGLLPGIAQQPATAVQIIDFEEAEAGELPSDLMVIDGEFQIVKEGENTLLQMLPAPLIDGAVLMGPSFRGAGTVKARIRAEKARRAFPRFGVGLHGISGVRLRVVPSQGEVELVIGDERLASAPFQWKEDAWHRLELTIRESDGKWTAEGRVWPEGAERPEEPGIQAALAAEPGSGKASVLGTPYANKPIDFDEVEVQPGR